MTFDERMTAPVRSSYILTITYGYVGIWNNQLTNFSDRGTIVFDTIIPNYNLNTAHWIDSHRQQLIDDLLIGLIENFKKKHKDSFDPYVTIIPMCHVISESIVVANSYFGESY